MTPLRLLVTLHLHLILGATNSTLPSQPERENSAYQHCLKEGGKVVSKVFCLPHYYRKDVIPPTAEGQPLTVYFKLPVSEISEIDDHKSIITIRLSYKLKWKETRMVINQTADWSGGEINISPDNIELFWTPDVIIHDLVKFNKPEILNQVGALEIFKSGQVYYKVRSDITVVCKAMEFGQFPLDKHKCYFMLTSFGYDSEHMNLSGRYSYHRENQRTLPFNVDIKDLPPHKRVFVGSSSNYSAYGFEILLSRSLGPFILSVYLPSAMFVMMSWVSFFVPPDIVPARIVLLVTLCLVLINMFNSTTTRIPVSNAVTAMEVWLLACMLLVFLSLVEYAIILRRIVIHQRNLERRRRQQMKHKQAAVASSTNGGEEEHGDVATTVTHLMNGKGSSKWKNRIRKNHCQIEAEAKLTRFKLSFDRAATYVFPFMFFLFNAGYWTVYLVIMPNFIQYGIPE